MIVYNYSKYIYISDIYTLDFLILLYVWIESIYFETLVICPVKFVIVPSHTIVLHSFFAIPEGRSLFTSDEFGQIFCYL